MYRYRDTCTMRCKHPGKMFSCPARVDPGFRRETPLCRDIPVHDAALPFRVNGLGRKGLRGPG